VITYLQEQVPESSFKGVHYRPNCRKRKFTPRRIFPVFQANAYSATVVRSKPGNSAIATKPTHVTHLTDRRVYKGPPAAARRFKSLQPEPW